MKNKFTLLVILIFIASSFSYVSAAPNRSSVEKATKQMGKRAKANSRYKNGDYAGALRIYREIYGANQEDAKLNFLIGRCNVKLNNMDDALVYLMKAQKLQPDIDESLPFLLGEAYQYLGKLDSAIIEFNIYKSSQQPNQLKNDPVNDLLAQTETAKELMAHPVNVTIKNLGPEINSEYDDGMPAISADGKTLIFTSRRPDTKGGAIDPNTGQYFDDIYISNWNDKTNTWDTATNNLGELNSTGHDAILGFSPDGNTIFLYRNSPISKKDFFVGGIGGGDIYYSTKKTDGKWGIPRPMPKPINSTYFEGSCSLSPDGNTLFFVSERKGGYGSADIWRSHRTGKNTWSKPVNLGPVINTEGDEMSVFMHPDGKTLFFASNGHKTMGGYDIFMTQMKPDSSWTEPVNLGYPINTTKNELSFTMTADGKKAYITSNKDNGYGGADIYEIDMSNYTFPLKMEGQAQTKTVETGLSILKGSVVRSDSAQQIEAEIAIKDISTGTVSKIYTNESGDYFVTLKGNKQYEITIEKEGYKKFTEKITLPFDANKTFTLTKVITLEKLPEEKK